MPSLSFFLYSPLIVFLDLPLSGHSHLHHTEYPIDLYPLLSTFSGFPESRVLRKWREGLERRVDSRKCKWQVQTRQEVGGRRVGESGVQERTRRWVSRRDRGRRGVRTWLKDNDTFFDGVWGTKFCCSWKNQVSRHLVFRSCRINVRDSGESLVPQL